MELLKDVIAAICVGCRNQTRTDPCEKCGRANPFGSVNEREHFEKLLNRQSDIITRIGDGMRLRVPHVSGPPAVVEGQLPFRCRGAIYITKEEADFVINSGKLWKLNRHRMNQLAGWEESGYDGDVADWYSLII